MSRICKGKTQKGEACKRRVATGEYCYQHQTQHTPATILATRTAVREIPRTARVVPTKTSKKKTSKNKNTKKVEIKKVRDPYNDDCCFCLETIKEEEKNMGKVFVTECNHQYHKACFKDMRKPQCPICNTVLTKLPSDMQRLFEERRLADRRERERQQIITRDELALVLQVLAEEGILLR